VRLASWNILNDEAVPNNLPQTKRTGKIAEQINEVKRGADSFAIFLCECENVENINEIARQTGLVIVGKPGLSRRRDEYCVFLADPATAKKSTVSRIVAGREPYALFKLKSGKANIIGLHLPSMIVLRFKQRRDLMRKVLELSPDAFLGDLNSPSFFISRRKISKAGYAEAHTSRRPLFPSRASRKENNMIFRPNLNLDALYHKKSVTISSPDHQHNRASDHPIIWADIEIW
jgi:hypothetical protein